MDENIYKAMVGLSTSYLQIRNDIEVSSAFYDMGMFLVTGRQDVPLGAHNHYTESIQDND